MPPPAPLSEKDSSSIVGRFFGVFRYSREAIGLVWQTDRRLTILLAVLTIFAGVIPGAIAYVGKLIVDAVVQAVESDPVSYTHLTLPTIYSV